MSVHEGTAFYSPDRRWRISADPGGKKFVLEYDGSYLLAFGTLDDLFEFLSVFGLHQADLIEE